jgi:hypothetical protein
MPIDSLQAQNSARLSVKTKTNLRSLQMSNIPKIKLRNSVTECGQSVRKENAGKFQNYGIKDCIISIAASKIQ